MDTVQCDIGQLCPTQRQGALDTFYLIILLVVSICKFTCANFNSKSNFKTIFLNIIVNSYSKASHIRDSVKSEPPKHVISLYN